MKKLLVLTTLFGLLLASSVPAFGDSVTVAPPNAEKGNDHYVGNREPLLPSPLSKHTVAWP